MNTPITVAGAFDAEWLLQPQGEARRLEAALASFAERGFDGSQYEAFPVEANGCPAFGLRIESQAGVWGPREWVVAGVVTLTDGLWPGKRTRVGREAPVYRGGPTIWTRGRTGESVYEGGPFLARRLEWPLFRNLAVLGIREAVADETWLPEGWGLSDEYTLEHRAPGGEVMSQWAYCDDEWGSGSVHRTHTGDFLVAIPRHEIREVAYHVAGRLAGVEAPLRVYDQRQAEFAAELAAAQLPDWERDLLGDQS